MDDPRRVSADPSLECDMDIREAVADALEDAAIGRFQRARSMGVRAQALLCSACGAIQTVGVQQGMRMVAFTCLHCYSRTRAWCDHE